MKNKFNVEGMHCASCSAHVEKSVSSLEGVHSCNVNLLQNSMLVDFDEAITSIDTINNAVKKIGFSSSLAEKKQINKENKKENELKKKKLIFSIILLIPLMYFSMGHMLSLPFTHLMMNQIGMITSISIQFILTTIILVLYSHYYTNGFKLLFKGQPSMDSLIAVGSGSAYLYSLYLFILYLLHSNDISYLMMHLHSFYFESAAMIVTLISLGKYLEDNSKKKTSEAVSKLMDLTPKSVIVVRDEKEIEIDFDDIMLNEMIVIKPGQYIPVDGIIVQGHSAIDESSISGESIPVDKKVNDSIISGTFNTNGSFIMKALKIKEETTLAQIIKMVEDASSSKPRLAKIADKVSGIFVNIVMIIALLVFFIWLLAGYSFSFALSIAISVLVISCPCALGLATPTAIMVGSGKAAENGILLKRSESLEEIEKVDTIILDKTGTITLGKPILNKIVSKQEEFILKIAASIEKFSEHPLSIAILNEAKNKDISFFEATSFEAILGQGAKGIIDEVTYYVGNKKLIQTNKIDDNNYFNLSKQYSNQGQTTIFVANEEEVLGILCISDTIKNSSREAIKQLKEKNLNIYMVSGDNQNTCDYIQNQLLIDKTYAECSPMNKEEIIKDLQKDGHHVMMVGDGVNDSIALSRANVSLAIGAGSDVAIECADIVLVKNDLMDVVKTIQLSHDVIKNIKQNLFWAFFYNIIGIPLAAGILYIPFNILLNPMFGAAAMSLSSVCVVMNALRLKNK